MFLNIIVIFRAMGKTSVSTAMKNFQISNF